MEVSLITEVNKCIVRHAKKRFTCIFSSNKIAWIKFLHHSQFVGMKWSSLWRIRLTERADNSTAVACLRAERWGDRKTESLTMSMFWDDRAVRGTPGFFFFISPVSLKLFTNETIDCRPGTRPRGAILKWVRNARCVAMTERPLEKYISTANECSTFVHSMMLTKPRGATTLHFALSDMITPTLLRATIASGCQIQISKLLCRTLYL